MEQAALTRSGFHAIDCRTHVRDIHATVLHPLGLNHGELLYFHNGRFERPTVNDGKVVKEVLGYCVMSAIFIGSATDSIPEQTVSKIHSRICHCGQIPQVDQLE